MGRAFRYEGSVFKYEAAAFTCCSSGVTATHMEPAHHLSFGPFRLDVQEGRLWRGEQRILLRPRSLAVLRHLLEHAGRLVTKAELRQHVWGGTHVTDTVLRVCVQEIRAALDDTAATPRYLETVGRQGYRVHPAGDSDVPPLMTAGPVVGRRCDVAILEEWFQHATQGHRRLGFVSGEAGIGKTTLIDLWLAGMAAGSAARIGRGQCSEHYGEAEPYMPLFEALGQLSRGTEAAAVTAVLRRYAPLWLAQLPGLVSEVELERLQRQVQGVTQARMLRELAQALEVLTAARPLVLVLEDLHWSDLSTVEFLTYLAQRRESARLLVLGTYRPAEAVIQSPHLRRAVQELCGRGQAADLRLELLPAEPVAAYVAGHLGGPVAAPLAAFVHARTDGNALFMVNILEHLVRRGLVVRRAGEWTLQAEAEAFATSLPEGVQQLIMRRFDDLPPEAQRVLEAASVVGEAFTVAAVAAGAQCPVEAVEAVCEELAAQHRFLDDTGLTKWPDGTSSGCYRFQHALYPQVLYERLGTVRRAGLHRRIGARLEAGYGIQAEEIAAQLAVHFERGGELERATDYWRQAGANAARRHAFPDAIAALRKGLALLATLPERSERSQRELVLQFALGDLLSAVRGLTAPEAGEAYTRAYALCQHVGETSWRSEVLWGLTLFHCVGAQLEPASRVSRELFDLAQRQPDAVLLQKGYCALGMYAFARGHFGTARAHLEASIRLCNAPPPSSPLFHGVCDQRMRALCYLAQVLWALGWADQAQQRMQEALAVAQQGESPPTLGNAQVIAAVLCQWRRDAATTCTYAEAVMALAEEQGFGLRGEQGRILRGWALAMRGHETEGVAQIRQAFAMYPNMEPGLYRAYFLGLLGEACSQVGQPAAGLRAVDEALVLVATTEVRWWAAELHRLQGVLQLQLPSPDVSQAERCFQQALAVARAQQAKALELRAALSLSRLWQQQGQRVAAHALLAPIYGWFTEGFDTTDLQEAKALLEELSSSGAGPGVPRGVARLADR
jgi:predicted ATPase/DNA-binding winged helix-turn-helix (wHTH) protein